MKKLLLAFVLTLLPVLSFAFKEDFNEYKTELVTNYPAALEEFNQRFGDTTKYDERLASLEAKHPSLAEDFQEVWYSIQMFKLMYLEARHELQAKHDSGEMTAEEVKEEHDGRVEMIRMMMGEIKEDWKKTLAAYRLVGDAVPNQAKLEAAGYKVAEGAVYYKGEDTGLQAQNLDLVTDSIIVNDGLLWIRERGRAKHTEAKTHPDETIINLERLEALADTVLYDGDNVYRVSRSNIDLFEPGVSPDAVGSYGSGYVNINNAIHYTFPTLKKIAEADVQSFEVKTSRLARDANNVFLMDKLVPGADPETFEPVSESSNHSKDKNAVYWGSPNNTATPTKLDLDINTFEIVDLEYAKDAQKVFYQDKEVLGLDPDNFEIVAKFGSTHYVKDSTKVMYKISFDFVELEGADATSFEVLVSNLGGKTYAKDENNVYFRESRKEPFTITNNCQASEVTAENVEDLCE